MTAGIDLGSSNWNLEASLFSRKLTVASWNLLLLPQGRGSSDSNTVMFHVNPPKFTGHFGAVLEADGHGLKPARVSTICPNYKRATPPAADPSTMESNLDTGEGKVTTWLALFKIPQK